jgi:hypothetical protein
MAASVAVAAGDATRASWSDPAEVGVLDLDAGAAEIDADRRLVEGLSSPDLGRDLLEDAVHVGGHVGVADDAQHSSRLIEAGRQLIGPVGDFGPLGRVEELLGGT